MREDHLNRQGVSTGEVEELSGSTSAGVSAAVDDFMKALGVDYALLARGPFSQALLHDPAFTVVESDQGHLVFKVGPLD